MSADTDVSDVVLERARVVVLALLGPVLAWAQVEALLWQILIPIWWVLAIGGLLYSRVGVLGDRELARRVSSDSDLYVFGEALIIGVVFLFVGTALGELKAPNSGVFAIAGCAAVGVYGYSRVLRGRARRDRSPHPVEAATMRKLEWALLGFEAAVLGVTFNYLESLRHEVALASSNGSPVGELAFFACLLLLLLAPGYMVLIRFRTRIVQADVRTELFVALSGYLAFMLTPPMPHL